MTDTRFISSIRQALDESAEHLPLHTAHRLTQARLAALDCVPRQDPQSVPVQDRTVSGSGLRPRFALFPLPGKGWQFTAVAFSLSLLIAGLVVLGELDARRDASELAELEAAVLADEVPMSAYADRGFGAYLLKTGLGSSPTEATSR